MGTVFKLQRFSLHDGPGIRTTVFLKGCPLRCGWCCNPESQAEHGELFFYERLCTGCGACAGVCAVHAVDPRSFQVDRGRCVACGRCAKACPSGAKERVGERMDAESVVAIAERDMPFYKNSGGGVTLSGGEPAMQPRFAEGLLSLLREKGIHTAMETSGCAPAEVLTRLASHCDLLLFDLKTLDPEKLPALGLRAENQAEALAGLFRAGRAVVLRYAIIPGFNDGEADVAAFAALAAQYPFEAVNLMPFHRLADGKYGALGRTYAYAAVSPFEGERLARVRDRFAAQGIPVSIEA